MGSRALRLTGWIVAVAGITLLGFFVGQRLGHRGQGAGTASVNGPWKVGDAFPDVPVLTEDGDSTSTHKLLENGGVVLFLDLECHPCLDMARKWNRAVLDGVVPVEEVVAITLQPASSISRFRADNRLEYDVFCDADRTFLTRYGVNAYPLEVMVDAAGAVVHTNSDPAEPIDEQMLAGLINTH